MTLDLDELERKAKAVIASNANLPDGEPPYSMGLAASDVLALIERVRALERYKAAALKTMDALTRECEALESAAKAAGVKDA